jgi:uncharacterized protein (TIGR02271 family)
MENQDTPAVIPVIEEELVSGKAKVKTGSVRVRKTIEHSRKLVEMPAVRDVVDVKRIAVNRAIDSMPQMREEGDTLVIPVIEEEIVIQKRLILKEEIHIKRRRTRERVAKEVTVDREHAVVERLDQEGRVISTSAPAASASPAQQVRRRRSLVE